MMLETQIMHDLRQEEANDVGSRRNTITGPQLFRDGTTAENVPSFQQADRFAGLGEIGGGNESIVATSDDDAIVCRFHNGRIVDSFLGRR